MNPQEYCQRKAAGYDERGPRLAPDIAIKINCYLQ